MLIVVVNIVSAALASGAAFFWYQSSKVSGVPVGLGVAAPGVAAEIAGDSIRAQGRLSSRAALCAAGAAVFQAISAITPTVANLF